MAKGKNKSGEDRLQKGINVASSSSAAAAMQRSGGGFGGSAASAGGGGTSKFIGFGAFARDAPSSDAASVATAQSTGDRNSNVADFYHGPNAELSALLKNALKRDTGTRIKTLQSLASLYESLPAPTVRPTLLHWAHNLDRLTLDNDRRVREGALSVTLALAHAVPKAVCKHAARFAPLLMLLSADPTDAVAHAAKQAIDVIVPVQQDTPDELMCDTDRFGTVASRVVRDYSFRLFQQAGGGSSNKKEGGGGSSLQVQADERQQRVQSCVLKALGDLIGFLSNGKLHELMFDNTLHAADVSNISHGPTSLRKLLTDERMLKLLTSEHAVVRRAAIACYSVAAQHAPWLLVIAPWVAAEEADTSLSHLQVIVSNSDLPASKSTILRLTKLFPKLLGEQERMVLPVTCAFVVACLQSYSAFIWSPMEYRKSFFPHLWSLLKHGARGAVGGVHSSQLSLMALTPQHVWEEYGDIFAQSSDNGDILAQGRENDLASSEDTVGAVLLQEWLNAMWTGIKSPLLAPHGTPGLIQAQLECIAYTFKTKGHNTAANNVLTNHFMAVLAYIVSEPLRRRVEGKGVIDSLARVMNVVHAGSNQQSPEFWSRIQYVLATGRVLSATEAAPVLNDKLALARGTDLLLLVVQSNQIANQDTDAPVCVQMRAMLAQNALVGLACPTEAQLKAASRFASAWPRGWIDMVAAAGHDGVDFWDRLLNGWLSASLTSWANIVATKSNSDSGAGIGKSGVRRRRQMGESNTSYVESVVQVIVNWIDAQGVDIQASTLVEQVFDACIKAQTQFSAAADVDDNYSFVMVVLTVLLDISEKALGQREDWLTQALQESSIVNNAVIKALEQSRLIMNTTNDANGGNIEKEDENVQKFMSQRKTRRNFLDVMLKRDLLSDKTLVQNEIQHAARGISEYVFARTGVASIESANGGEIEPLTFSPSALALELDLCSCAHHLLGSDESTNKWLRMALTGAIVLSVLDTDNNDTSSILLQVSAKACVDQWEKVKATPVEFAHVGLMGWLSRWVLRDSVPGEKDGSNAMSAKAWVRVALSVRPYSSSVWSVFDQTFWANVKEPLNGRPVVRTRARACGVEILWQTQQAGGIGGDTTAWLLWECLLAMCDEGATQRRQVSHDSMLLLKNFVGGLVDTAQDDVMVLMGVLKYAVSDLMLPWNSGRLEGLATLEQLSWAIGKQMSLSTKEAGIKRNGVLQTAVLPVLGPILRGEKRNEDKISTGGLAVTLQLKAAYTLAHILPGLVNDFGRPNTDADKESDLNLARELSSLCSGALTSLEASMTWSSASSSDELKNSVTQLAARALEIGTVLVSAIPEQEEINTNNFGSETQQPMAAVSPHVPITTTSQFARTAIGDSVVYRKPGVNPPAPLLGKVVEVEYQDSSSANDIVTIKVVVDASEVQTTGASIHVILERGRQVVYTQGTQGDEGDDQPTQQRAVIKGVHFDDLANGVYYTLEFSDGREVQTTEGRVQGLVKKANADAKDGNENEINAPSSLAQLQRQIAEARTKGDRKESLRLMKLLPSFMPKPVDSDVTKKTAADKAKRLAHEAELRVQRAKDTVREARNRGDSTDDEQPDSQNSSVDVTSASVSAEGTRSTSDGQLLNASGFLAVLAATTLPMRQQRTLMDGASSLAPLDSNDRSCVLRAVYQLPLIAPIRRQAAAQRMGSQSDKISMAAFQGAALSVLLNAVSDATIRRGLVANLTQQNDESETKSNGSIERPKSGGGNALREHSDVAIYMWQLMLLVVQEAQVQVEQNGMLNERVAHNLSRVCQLVVALQACDVAGEHMASLWTDSRSMRSMVLTALGHVFLALVDMRTEVALDVAQVISVLLPIIGSRFFLLNADEQVENDADADDDVIDGLPFDKLCTALGCGRPVISANVFKTLQRCTESELFKRVLSPSALSVPDSEGDNTDEVKATIKDFPASVRFSIEDDERETVRRGACRVPVVLRQLLDTFTSHAQEFALDSHHHYHDNNNNNSGSKKSNNSAGTATVTADAPALDATTTLAAMLAWLVVLRELALAKFVSASAKHEITSWLHSTQIAQAVLGISFAALDTGTTAGMRKGEITKGGKRVDGLDSAAGASRVLDALFGIGSDPVSPARAGPLYHTVLGLDFLHDECLGWEEEFMLPPHGVSTRLAAHVVFETVRSLPALVREWWSSLPRSEASSVDSFVTNEITTRLLTEDIGELKAATAAGAWDEEEIQVKGSVSARSVTALYTKDECVLEMIIRLPPSYPLKLVEVECTKRHGVREDRWRRWVLQIIALLKTQEGSILDAVQLWKRNVDQEFDGVEPCPICYSVLHSGDQSLPRLGCKTCHNTFHSKCLVKWFNSSHRNDCPMCRQTFSA